MLPATRGLRAFSSSREKGARQAAAPPGARTAQRPRRVIGCSATQGGDNFLDNVKRVAKTIQGALPIIGLVSRLTADEGGFDELAYPEYCRSMINSAPGSFKAALVDLEKRHGKVANSRYVLLMLWMAKTGTGLVAAKDVMNAAKRLRITQDMEIEIDRFSGAREATIKKYSMMQVPTGRLPDQVNLAVDLLCTLCIGLKDGEPAGDDDASMLVDVLQGAFPEAETAAIRASISSRPQRPTFASAT